MKKATAFLLAAFAAASAARAESYAWTGDGTDATSWNDEANWDPAGVPGGGDTATFSAAATIADGIAVSSGELKVVANGVAVALNGVISGAGSMYFQCANTAASKIAVAGTNTYAGGTTVQAYNINTYNAAPTHGVFVQNAAAFGSNRDISHVGGVINFDCANATFSYDIIPSGTTTVRYNAMQNCSIDGSITNDAYTAEMIFSTKKTGVTFTVDGKVGGTRANHINAYGYKGCDIRFVGGVETTGNIRHSLTADGILYGDFRLGTSVKAAQLRSAYGRWSMLDDDILDESIFLNFTHYSSGTYGINLNGTRQTVDRVESDNNTYSRCINSAADATLVLKPSKSAVAMVSVNGAVNLVLDAQDASYVQQFSNRVSTTTGSLVASNGILRIGANATFANVPKLVAANTGAIEVTSEVADALAGVREIVITGSGRVSLPGAALTAMSVAIAMDETASLEITDGTTLEVASLKIGATTVASGAHPAGSIGQIAGAEVFVANSVSPDSTGVWTGAGASESSLDSANWEGGFPGEIPVTFASGGTAARLGASLSAAGLKFDTPAGVPSFTVAAAESAPDAKLILSGDIVMTNAAHASGHTNVVSVPIAFTETSAKIRVDGAANGLVLDGPIQQQGASLALTRTGSGTLWLNATESTRTAGQTYLHGGTTYLAGGALGGTAASLVNVELKIDPNSADPVATYFTGGTYNQNFLFIRTGSKTHAARFAAGSTNVVNGCLRVQSNASFGLTFDGNSHTTVNGGFYEDYIFGYELKGTLYRGSVFAIRGKPLYTRQNASITTRFYAYSTGGTGDDAKIVFGAAGNISTNGLFVGGPLRVVMDVAFAFNTNSIGQATPLGLMQVPTDVNNDYLRATVVDLNGHSQRFGSLRTPTAGANPYGWHGYWGHSPYSYVTSGTPAALHVVQTVANAVDRPWKATFRGAMSLVKEGPNTLTLAGASTMTGRLEVAEGRLDFSGSGSMTNVSAFAVSGGVLAVDAKSRLPRKTDCYLSGGKLNLAEDVSLRIADLYVDDGNGGWTQMPLGMYSAANLPQYISGSGSLIVVGKCPGFILLVK